MSAAKILSHRKMKVFKLPALGECDQGFTICYEVEGLKLIYFCDCIFPMFIKYSMVLKCRKCSCKSNADNSWYEDLHFSSLQFSFLLSTIIIP